MNKAYMILRQIFSDIWLMILVEILAAGALLLYVIPQDTIVGYICSTAGWIIVAGTVTRIVYDAVKAVRQADVSEDNTGKRRPVGYPKAIYIVLGGGELVYFTSLFVIAVLQKPGTYGLLAAILAISVVSLFLTVAAYRKSRLKEKV